MDLLSGMTTFHEVVSAGSFSAAARRLGVTKSAVSRSVQKLETDLGTRLLNRSTRRISLTEAGEHYFATCGRILAEAGEVRRQLARLREQPEGRLRIATSIGFGLLHLIPALTDFKARYPGIEYDLVLEDHELDLVKERLDLSLRFGSMRDSSYIARRVASMGWAVCATPEYLERRGTPQTPADLAAHDFLLFVAVSNPDRWTFTRGEERHSVRVTGSFRSNNLLAIHAALRAGYGIGAVSRHDFADDIASGTVVDLLTDYSLPSIDVYTVYQPGHRDLPKVRLAVDFLADRWKSLR